MLDGTAELPPTPPPVFARAPLDGTDMTVVEHTLVQEGIQQWSRCLCRRPARSRVARRRICAPRNSCWHPTTFNTTVRSGIEARGMPKFAELSDQELDALRHYIRYRARLATRPSGVAPVVAAPAAPEKPETKKRPEPKQPPGSLESTAHRRRRSEHNTSQPRECEGCDRRNPREPFNSGFPLHFPDSR